MDAKTLAVAARALRSSTAVLVGAGAGMGVDSGLPDFRGHRGFWRAYPAYKHLGLSFAQLADPRWFRDDPRLAWGFYGHRLDLYRRTRPHRGFAILRALCEGRDRFVFTSNVDGQFQIDGWGDDAVYECHGSIHRLQCLRPCNDALWDAGDVSVKVDPESFRAVGDLPTCPECGDAARPNVLMFGDWSFVGDHVACQGRRYRQWLDGVDPQELVVIEIGAGTAIPSVRMVGEALAASGATLVRINPREADGPAGTLSLEVGGLEALERLEAALT